MKTPPPEATKTVYPILRQIVNIIPPNIFHATAAATKDLSRVFTPWSHAVALIYLQLTKTESLNGVCDAARVLAPQWQELRGAVPPRRNTFSNANRHRDPAMTEALYWAMKDDFITQRLQPRLVLKIKANASQLPEEASLTKRRRRELPLQLSRMPCQTRPIIILPNISRHIISAPVKSLLAGVHPFSTSCASNATCTVSVRAGGGSRGRRAGMP